MAIFHERKGTKMTYHILFNPQAGNGTGEKAAHQLDTLLSGSTLRYYDMTKIGSYADFFKPIPADEPIILAGGDGTINRFLNGIGYGIDGYCCEVGDKLRATSTKPVNYTAIAIKGLLFHYHPANAEVIVDSVSHTYRKVWLAPTMNGRYYGGGMEVAPAQDRLNAAREQSVVVMYGSGKLKTLIVFPSIFKGEHVKHKEMVEVLTGHEITVKFDRPCALQIDGETVLGVTEYSVSSKVPAAV